MAAGSTTITESNSSPLACCTGSTASGASSISGPFPADDNTERTRSSIDGDVSTATFPSGTASCSVRAASTMAACNASASPGATAVNRGSTPAWRTERDGVSSGAATASTRAATSMTSEGVR